MNPLSNKRQPGEAFPDYKARMKLVARNVTTYLKGRMAHVSTEIVHLPVFGTDAAVDRAVLAGQYRDIQQIFLPDGKEIHIARTKGKTYRRFPVGRQRREWREILGAFA